MRTVLTVEPVENGGDHTGSQRFHVFVERAPVEVPSAQRYGDLQLDMAQLPDWSAPDAVLVRGRMLRDLLGQHAGVAQLLPQLWAVPMGQVRPIFIKLNQGVAESITWETLCSASDQFVALNPRSPIGRITDPVSAPPRPPAALRFPLRVMAIISAFGVPGQIAEWRMLRDACQGARDLGLDVSLHVLVGDATIRQAIEAERLAGTSWVTSGPVEATGARVLQDVQSYRPHVLHFFCHGFAGPAGQMLELASGADLADPSALGGSVRISSQHLADASANLQDPLVLILNCCSGATAVEDLMSMAHQSVSAGFRAGVAMLEPVDAADAHEFTRAFYPTLFTELQHVKIGLVGAPNVPFEWATVMSNARAAISARHQDAPSCNREWAIPLLYVRGIDPMHFMRADETISEQEAADHRLMARQFARWLREAGRSKPEEVRRQIMEEVLADVPKRYWPTIDGAFANG